MSQRRWLMRTLMALMLLAFVSTSGCTSGRRVVLVPPGEPVQLAESVRAYVYVRVEGRREKSRNRVTLSEGWWCLPDPQAKVKNETD